MKRINTKKDCAQRDGTSILPQQAQPSSKGRPAHAL